MTASAVRRNGPYAPLGANYADDDAIATLDLAENDRAEVLWCRGLAYCARDLRLEGYISDIALRAGKVLRRRPGKKGIDTVMAAAQTLADLGLWTREGDGYRITAWLKWNKSWEEMTRKRATDRERKKTGDDDESESTPRRVATDSARKDGGVVAPKHSTSQHVTTRHDTDTSTSSATDAARNGNGAHTHPPDVEQLLEQTGPYVPKIRTALATELAPLVDAGFPDQALTAALEVWKTRKAGPKLLPHLVQDQLTPAQQQDPRFAGLLADARSSA